MATYVTLGAEMIFHLRILTVTIFVDQDRENEKDLR